MYYTIQGEGYYTGRAAVFCRFAGCNLWTGLEKDRDNAVCKFCDTDFFGTDGVNGGKYSLEELVDQISGLFYAVEDKFVVFTGGEPALQLDFELVEALHENGFYTAVETNGTMTLPPNVDWICVSPKSDAQVVLRGGDELKLVYPQLENVPEDFEDLKFDHYYIQPKEDGNWEQHIMRSVDYVKSHPKWKLSVQTHKYLRIP